MKQSDKPFSPKKAQEAQKRTVFFLRLLCLFAATGFGVFGCSSAHSAADFGKITGNMGGIDFNGLPRLSFEIVDRQDAGELAALGFEFTLMHQTKLRSGRTAGTEWRLPCPQTYAHVDTQGDVLWLTAGGRAVRFGKTGNGYASATGGASVNVSADGNVIEVTTASAIKWRYRDGFLESISSRMGSYAVTTDRETILSVSKKILNREIPLLRCAYSKQGFLEELEFAGGRKYRFHWSDIHDLLAVDGPEGRRFDFEYTNSLLACWAKANGPRNELKWRHLDYVRETAFQIPPVLLREDASHSCSLLFPKN